MNEDVSSIKNRWLFHCHVSLEDFVVSKVWNGRTLCLTDLLSADCEVKLLNLMWYRQDQVKHFRTLACAFWGPKFGTFHKANSWGLLCVGLFQIKLNHLLGSHHQLHHVIAWAFLRLVMTCPAKTASRYRFSLSPWSSYISTSYSEDHILEKHPTKLWL